MNDKSEEYYRDMLEHDYPTLLGEFHKLSEKNKKLLNMVKRASKNSCCMCCDSCLACDALQLLREIGETKIPEVNYDLNIFYTNLKPRNYDKSIFNITLMPDGNYKYERKVK